MSLDIETLLPTGRRVQLEQLHLLPNQADWTEASRPLAMKDRIPGLVAKLISPDVPYVLRDSDRWLLPQVCLSLFSSSPMLSQEVSVENSLLVVVWFTQDIHVPLRQLICEGLSGLNWEAQAKDFHSEW